jgi:hypothetical protein
MKDLSFAELEVVRFLDQMIAALQLDLSFEIVWRPESVPDLAITFIGPDVSFLTAEDGHLLRAVEHLAAAVGRLEPERRRSVAVATQASSDRAEDRLAGPNGGSQSGGFTGRPNLPERRRQHLQRDLRPGEMALRPSEDPAGNLSEVNPTSGVPYALVTTIACDCR